MSARTCDDCGRDLGPSDTYIEDFFGGVRCEACFDAVIPPDEEDDRDE